MIGREDLNQLPVLRDGGVSGLISRGHILQLLQARADRAGNVYVAWHAGAGSKGDATRRVWLARSTDDGRSFAREIPASAEKIGACGCCGMRAVTDKVGTLFLLFRSATHDIDRDMHLLTSRDRGQTFSDTLIHKWKLEACPLSTAFIGQAATGAMPAWETNGQVYYSVAGGAAQEPSTPVEDPGVPGKRKHPVIVAAADGRTLLCSPGQKGWKKGGSLAWQVFDRTGKLASEVGHVQVFRFSLRSPR